MDNPYFGIGRYAPAQPTEWLFWVEPNNPDIDEAQVQEAIRIIATEFMKLVGFSIQLGTHRSRDGTKYHASLQIVGPVGPNGTMGPVMGMATRGETLLEAARNARDALKSAERERGKTIRVGCEYDFGMFSSGPGDVEDYLDSLKS